MKICDNDRLCTPGPVNVPARVLAAGARPMIHHRTAQFSAIVKDVIEKLQSFFVTETTPLLVHTTGRGSMEGAVINLFSKGDEVISVTNGKFGRMFAEIAETYGLKVHRIAEDDNKDLSLECLEETIKANPNVKAVTLCHGDTSTGRKADIAAVARIARKYGILTLVDCICTAGCERISFDESGVDVLITCSQKGMMCPTGMSIVLMSDRAWEKTRTSELPKYYVDFKAIREIIEKKYETPGSTPVSLVCSLQESLTMLQEEGREEVFARHDKIAAAVRAGLLGMGLELFPTECKERVNCMTAFLPPEGVEAKQIKQMLQEQYGLIIAGGIGKQSGKILRLAHMGAFYKQDALMVISAIEAVLYQLSDYTPGPGIRACIEALTCMDCK